MSDIATTDAAPQSCGAMAFSHPDLTVASDLASRFAGAGGRIATLPDIVDAKMATAAGAFPWEAAMVTSSGEYLGHSAGGIPIIVVAHGLGPLADPKASPHSFLEPSAKTDWRITPEAFRALEQGFYGPVGIVELRTVLRSRKFPFLEMLTYQQASDDPLVRLRLGVRAQDFLDLHRRMSLAFLRDRGWETCSNACVLSMRDANFLPYACTDVTDAPMAHPLLISNLYEYTHGHWVGPAEHVSLVTELACHERGDHARTVGVRGPVSLRDIAAAAAAKR